LEFQTLSLEELSATVTTHGGSDLDYLNFHYPRFAATLSEFCGSWDSHRGMRMLDVGAHWLHQSVMYAHNNFEVTALDFPVTFEQYGVYKLAEDHNIKLIPNNNLEYPTTLDEVEDNSFDIILFTEIIEHLTFNPVNFWKQIYRVLAPGGRIIVTTPNYYGMRSRAWSFARFLKGLGGGLSVDSILNQRTYAHHWREFSMREVIMYFCVLSPDFNTVKRLHREDFSPPPEPRLSEKAALLIEKMLPVVRPQLHLEIELSSKQAGIQLEPSW